jgi:hypothetical protein
LFTIPTRRFKIIFSCRIVSNESEARRPVLQQFERVLYSTSVSNYFSLLDISEFISVTGMYLATVQNDKYVDETVVEFHIGESKQPRNPQKDRQ